MDEFKLSINKTNLSSYLDRQLMYFFPDGKNDTKILCKFVDKALQRTEHCFKHINGKYFTDGNDTFFNHLNGDQYCMFLYFGALSFNI